MTLPDGSTGYYATGSYAANGQLPWGTGTIPRSFPKGPENTILIGERPQVCRTAAGEDVYNLWGLGIYSPHMPAFAALTPADPPGLSSTGQVAPAEPLPDETATDRDAQLRVRIGRRDAEPGPPDFDHPIQVIRGSRPCDPRLPGTPHRAGMQVAMADGSVRVFAPDTSPWVFWSACLPGKAKDDAGEGR
jgi:prepilin-type processing-associated H-X9-DG protein